MGKQRGNSKSKSNETSQRERDKRVECRPESVESGPGETPGELLMNRPTPLITNEQAKITNE